MEVHHHPNVEKKSFKEYLLEGLMIFIAVTMGFFAESLREHINDRSKETEYMTAFVKDLARDTSEINRTLRVDIDILRHINTLQDVMLKVPSDQPSIIQAYKLVFYTMDEETVNFSDAGYSQLKNSGDMRLIHFPEVADSILDYESGVKNCRDQAGYYAQQTVKLFSESKHIFQPDFGIAWWKTAITYTDTSVEQRRTPPGFYDSLSVSHPFSFMTTDPKVFQEYCSEVFIDNRVITSYVEQIQRQKRKALSLMKFLEGKYDIPVPGKPE